VIFEDKWYLIKDIIGNNIFKVKIRVKGFTLNLMGEEQSAFSINTFNGELWHKRPGYFHHVRLIYMQKHNLVKGVSWLENISTNCAACQYGKQARKPFPQTTWRVTHKLQPVHTDVGGP